MANFGFQIYTLASGIQGLGPTGMTFTILDRHILGEWLKAFALMIGITVGILILADMSDNLPDMLNAKASTAEILTYYFLVTPAYLPTVIPVSHMLAILVSLGNMQRRSQVTAMRAAGMSLWQITRTVWGASAVLTLLLLMLNASWIPDSVEVSRRILERFDRIADTRKAATNGTTQAAPLMPEAIVTNLGFNNGEGRRLWFINTFKPESLTAEGVSVYLFDEEHNETERILASSATYDPRSGKWRFEKGQLMRFNAETGAPWLSKRYETSDRAAPVSTIGKTPAEILSDTEFRNQISAIVDKFDENPAHMSSLTKRAKDLSLNELSRAMEYVGDSGDPRHAAYSTRYHQIISSPAICLLVCALAIPFATTGVRVNPMIGISKALGFFLLLYVLSAAGIAMGEAGMLPAILAGWGPIALMAWISKRLIAKAA